MNIKWDIKSSSLYNYVQFHSCGLQAFSSLGVNLGCNCGTNT